MKDILEKYKIVIAIIVGCLIIGGSLVIIQVNKQNSIEYQKILDNNVKQDLLDFEKEKYEDEKNKESYAKLSLGFCLDDADEDYWYYMGLNGTKDEEGVVTAQTRHWNIAEENKQTDIENCHKQYK
jgi:hypothetical protein